MNGMRIPSKDPSPSMPPRRKSLVGLSRSRSKSKEPSKEPERDYSSREWVFDDENFVYNCCVVPSVLLRTAVLEKEFAMLNIHGRQVISHSI